MKQRTVIITLFLLGLTAFLSAQNPVSIFNPATGLLAVLPVDVAHDSVDSGNPSKIGFRASNSLAAATMVSAADRTDALSGVDGILPMRPNTLLEDTVSGIVAITDGSSTSTIAAAGASVKYYVTGYSCSNTSAVNVTVDIRDGTAGSVKWTFPCPNGGGGNQEFVTPLGGFTANTALAIDPSASASTVTVSLKAFKSKI